MLRKTFEYSQNILTRFWKHSSKSLGSEVWIDDRNFSRNISELFHLTFQVSYQLPNQKYFMKFLKT